MNNYINHIKFWFTLGSSISLISIFIIFTLLVFFRDNKEFIVDKSYGIFLIPFIIYMLGIAQFTFNYFNLIKENGKDRSN